MSESLQKENAELKAQLEAALAEIERLRAVIQQYQKVPIQTQPSAPKLPFQLYIENHQNEIHYII